LGGLKSYHELDLFLLILVLRAACYPVTISVNRRLHSRYMSDEKKESCVNLFCSVIRLWVH